MPSFHCSSPDWRSIPRSARTDMLHKYHRQLSLVFTHLYSNFIGWLQFHWRSYISNESNLLELEINTYISNVYLRFINYVILRYIKTYIYVHVYFVEWHQRIGQSFPINAEHKDSEWCWNKISTFMLKCLVAYTVNTLKYFLVLN